MSLHDRYFSETSYIVFCVHVLHGSSFGKSVAAYNSLAPLCLEEDAERKQQQQHAIVSANGAVSLLDLQVGWWRGFFRPCWINSPSDAITVDFVPYAILQQENPVFRREVLLPIWPMERPEGAPKLQQGDPMAASSH